MRAIYKRVRSTCHCEPEPIATLANRLAHCTMAAVGAPAMLTSSVCVCTQSAMVRATLLSAAALGFLVFIAMTAQPAMAQTPSSRRCANSQPFSAANKTCICNQVGTVRSVMAVITSHEHDGYP